MKKTYIKPSIETVALQTERNILAASGDGYGVQDTQYSTDVTILSKNHDFDLWDEEEED